MTPSHTAPPKLAKQDRRHRFQASSRFGDSGASWSPWNTSTWILRPMPFEKGKSGNPGGQSRARPFKDALNMEIRSAGDEHKALREIAKQLISKAKGGDLQAINALVDRLDGKPVTTVKLDLTNSLSSMKPDEAIGAIADHVAAGEISPQEGQQLTGIIEAKIKSIDMADLERRLSQLEASK